MTSALLLLANIPRLLRR